MADFRRCIIALTVLALCVAGAYAQVGVPTGGAPGTATGTPFSCTVTNGAVTPQLRQEGLTELVGDILLNCSGGTPIAPGATIPTATITVYLNTQVTSRLLGTGSTAGASEAVLFIDEPNTGLTGYGPAVPVGVCGNPTTGGCPAWVGNSTVPAPAGATNIGVMVSSNPNTCTAVGTPAGCTAAGGFNPAPVAPAQNVYQGVVDPINSKYVSFYGVPMMPPVSAGDSRVFRITNVRANANGIPAGSGNAGYAQALISISGSSFVPLTNSQLIVGYVQPGLTASLRSTSNSGSLSSSGAQFSQCSSNPGDTAILRFAANFPTAFKTRVLAGTNGASSGQTASGIQNVPGGINNATSESGYIFNGLGTPSAGSLSGNGNTAGLADFGTRMKAVFSNIPAGVSLNVSTVNVLSNTAVFNSTTTAFPTNAVAPPASSTSNTYAQLIVSDTSPENGVSAPVLTATGANNTSSSSTSSGVPIVTFTPAAGSNTVTAVWEVVNSNTTLNQNFDFLVSTSYSANVANNTPAAPSTVTVSLSYAPISSTSSASTSAVIPRFVDLGSGDNKTLFAINICQTSLLFPYVSTITGFETGLAISNTSMDPFTTGLQAGACTLNWYGNNNGGSTNTPIPSSTTAVSGAPVIAAGTTWTGAASSSNMAGQGFTGYMIAVCNFQYAHGYAAITDVGTRGILTAYLALVLNNTSTARTGTPAKETLTH